VISILPRGSVSRPAPAPRGARLHDWASCELADLEAAEYNEDNTGLWTRGLLIRRNIADGELAFFSTWCPAGTAIATLVAVEGHRWAIEDAFETAKNELGLDHNETRSWHGLLARMASSRVAGEAGVCDAGENPPTREHDVTPKNTPAGAPGPTALIRWSIQEIRRIAVRLAQRRIQPAHVIAWSSWRRAHQALAQKSHRKRTSQLTWGVICQHIGL
jgi:hypothetical protein